MAKRGTIFTLIAASYTLNGVRLEKGFVTTLGEGDPNLPKFAGNPAFKAEPTEMPDPVSVKEPEKVIEKLTKEAAQATKLSDLPAIPLKKESIDGLAEKGIVTVGDVLKEETEHDDLTTVNGIGDKTADKLIEFCEAFVESAE